MKVLLVLISLSVINVNAQFSDWWRTGVSDFELTGAVKTMRQKAYYKYRGKKKVKQLIKNPDHIDNDKHSGYLNRETEFSPTGKIVKDVCRESRSFGVSGNSGGVVTFDIECSYNERDDWFYFIGYESMGYDRVIRVLDSAIYNGNGNLLEQHAYWYGILTWSHYYTYNQDNSLKTDQLFHLEKPYRESNYEYDSLGYTTVSQSISFTPAGVSEQRFNLNDSLVYMKYSQPLNHTNTRIDYLYNEAGLLTKKMEVVNYDSLAANGPLVQTLVDRYEYDAFGNCTLFEKYNADGEVLKSVIRKYSDQGLIIEEVNIQDGGQGNSMIDRKKIYTYDNQNNMVLLEHQYEAFSKIHARFIAYTYDNQGNWLSRVMRENGKVVSYVEREITYY